jgi:hypothetical protein
VVREVPRALRHILLNPPEDTDPKRLGRATHIAAFEPERFRNSIAMWDGPRRAGKDWEAFKQRNEGKELLTEDQHGKCMAIQKSVREDPVAKQYMQNGRGEVNLAWTTTTIESGAEFQCKGRIDFDAQDAIVDLKTTRDASPDAFARQVFGLRYHTQGAWYSDAYALLTGKRKPYVIVAVEWCCSSAATSTRCGWTGSPPAARATVGRGTARPRRSSSCRAGRTRRRRHQRGPD